MLDATDPITAAVSRIFAADTRFIKVRDTLYGYRGAIDGMRVGVVVATKTPRFENSVDHALNKGDLDKLIAGLDAGRIDQGFVVTATVNQFGRMVLVSVIGARELAERLQTEMPRSGSLGAFYLVNANFAEQQETF